MNRLLFISLLFLLQFIGCDSSKSTGQNVKQSSGSLSAGEQDELTGQSEFEGCREEPSSLVALSWDKSNLNLERFVEEISITVTNKAESTLAIAAKLLCSGLLNQSASVELGTYELDAGESIPITVEAEKIPIQNMEGASQLIVKVVATMESEMGTAQQTFQSTPLYYRFTDNYSKITFFNRKYLVERYGGLLAGPTVGPSGERQILGRMNNGNGKFVEVTNEDEVQMVEVQSNKGLAGGRLIKTSISSGHEDENGNFVEGDRGE